MTAAVAAGAVALAAVVLGWPAGRRRARRRRVLAGGSSPSRWRPPAGPPAWLTGGGRLRGGALARWRGGTVWLLVAAGVALAVVLGGPVAGLVAGGYGASAARAALRRDAARTRAARRSALLDLLGSAAADLRAGLPADTALPVDTALPAEAPLRVGTASPVDTPRTAGGPAAGPEQRLPARVRAAARLAERTGAPLADVVERIEADARSTDRARAASAAQLAGARATAWLLAGLPAGGLALGYAIGADPLAVLLHTPLGAACAAGALALQLAGLAWAGRLTRPVRVGAA